MNKLFFYIKHPLQLVVRLIILLPYFNFIKKTSDYQCPITFKMWFFQKILNIGDNRKANWPVHFTSKVVNPKNITIGIDTNPGYMGGCYIQGIGKIIIGDYTQIGPRVSIISANHDINDTRIHLPEKVEIGKYCWLGANSTILPNVILGDFTIVGAGSVVTKSFSEGYCVIAGNPARKIKNISPENCIRYEYENKFKGYYKI
ncbi:MAG: acyltransferase [Flavobacteriales bacterium]|nr:acyltransferase [Flavobacteriales bacterium]